MSDVETGAGVTSASVIIRTKNEQAGLGPTLEAVYAQAVQPLEIIVIDSGSTDATLEVARRFPVRLLTIDPSQWGYSRTLNQAAGVACGDILVCLSAHCVAVDDRWLANLVRHFDDPRVAAVWGPSVRPGRPVPPPDEAMVQEPGTYGFHNRMWGLSNGNSAIRRDLWQQFPFDETLPAAEDKAWAREAMARGYTIVHDPRAAVWHAAHRFPSAFRRSRAVQQGLLMMFPDSRPPRLEPLRNVVRAASRTMRANIEHRDMAALRRDVRRLPSIVAGATGTLLAERRSRRSPTVAGEAAAGRPSPGPEDPGTGSRGAGR